MEDACMELMAIAEDLFTFEIDISVENHMESYFVSET
jgi:hypothetical protein